MIIEEITIESKYYPERLKKIFDVPKKLYVLGNKEILNKKGVAIVGSRNASEYGKKIAMQIAYELALNDVNVISGLAVRN